MSSILHDNATVGLFYYTDHIQSPNAILFFALHYSIVKRVESVLQFFIQKILKTKSHNADTVNRE